MSLMESIRAKAKAELKTIVLPEGEEERTLKAAVRIADEKIAKLIMLGDVCKIKEGLGKYDESMIQIVDPCKADKLQKYADLFYELRKAKGVTPEQALEKAKDPLYYAVLAIKAGDADGMVSGAIHSTGDTIRPALQVIKTVPGIKTISSCFIMDIPNKKYGDNGIMLFGDCAINICPTAEELAAIAISTAKTAESLCGIQPRVAMLSFSTKGSAKHELVDKVSQATALVKEQAPDLMVDGELQADAALVESVGQLKSPGSPVAGKANVLIFPDIQAGNIGYKLVQRLGGAEAIGPISQGMAGAVNDLSRGCSVQDIVDVTAITAVQAQNM